MRLLDYVASSPKGSDDVHYDIASSYVYLFTEELS